MSHPAGRTRRQRQPDRRDCVQKRTGSTAGLTSRDPLVVHGESVADVPAVERGRDARSGRPRHMHEDRPGLPEAGLEDQGSTPDQRDPLRPQLGDPAVVAPPDHPEQLGHRYLPATAPSTTSAATTTTATTGDGGGPELAELGVEVGIERVLERCRGPVFAVGSAIVRSTAVGSAIA